MPKALDIQDSHRSRRTIRIVRSVANAEFDRRGGRQNPFGRVHGFGREAMSIRCPQAFVTQQSALRSLRALNCPSYLSTFPGGCRVAKAHNVMDRARLRPLRPLPGSTRTLRRFCPTVTVSSCNETLRLFYSDICLGAT